MQYYQGGELAIERKADDSPVTAADLASHAVLQQALAREFPTWPQMSEEAADIPGRSGGAGKPIGLSTLSMAPRSLSRATANLPSTLRLFTEARRSQVLSMCPPQPCAIWARWDSVPGVRPQMRLDTSVWN